MSLENLTSVLEELSVQCDKCSIAIGTVMCLWGGIRCLGGTRNAQEAGGGAAWWMGKARVCGGENTCSDSEDGIYKGKEVCAIVQTSSMWLIYMWITQRLCVTLGVVLEGGRGVVGPDMQGS